MSKQVYPLSGCHREGSQKKERKKKNSGSSQSGYLRLHATILDLAGIQTLLVWALHAGIHSSTAVAHGVDGALIMEARSVGDDL